LSIFLQLAFKAKLEVVLVIVVWSILEQVLAFGPFIKVLTLVILVLILLVA